MPAREIRAGALDRVVPWLFGVMKQPAFSARRGMDDMIDEWAKLRRLADTKCVAFLNL